LICDRRGECALQEGAAIAWWCRARDRERRRSGGACCSGVLAVVAVVCVERTSACVSER